MIVGIPDREAFLDASLSLLRHYDLPPERVDRSSGLIVTHRTASAQWFEFWRVDSPGPYQTLESSLHTIGRTVTITVQPLAAAARAATEPTAAPEPVTTPVATQAGPETPPATTAPAERYRLTVRVDKERYSAPERQVTTPSGGLAIFNEKIPTEEGLRGAESARAQWVPLGRDPLLESYLLTKLVDATPDIEIIE